MLRRIDIDGEWRSLEAGFWPEDLPAGGRTIVYGHNGSGKSTLSELLLQVSEGSSSVSAVWEDENQKRTTIGTGGKVPQSVSVFTRKWIRANLTAFLDGASASAIVTLGSAAIDSKEEEQELERKLKALRAKSGELEALSSAAHQKAEAIVREVQAKIITELRPFDPDKFTKNRYAAPRLKRELAQHADDFPDKVQCADAIAYLAAEAPSVIETIEPAPQYLDVELTVLPELLSETPTRTALTALEQNRRAQTWVENGLGLHEELDHCLFCDATVSDSRRRQLALHFDTSWTELRGRAQTMQGRISTALEALSKWVDTLPDAHRLSAEFHERYQVELLDIRENVERRAASLKQIQAALDPKIEDPGCTPGVPDSSILTEPLEIGALMNIVQQHNEAARNHSEETSKQQLIVLDHIRGSRYREYNAVEVQVRDSQESVASHRIAMEEVENRLEVVRKQRFTTKKMADQLTDDLARVYGKSHLVVELTNDGKSYACRRGEKAATDLSDGERTTLSLLYFLRQLDDEGQPGGERKQRIVVIDDPSSSLDREALFATHQWLIDTLDDFGQFIILTHDFGLLRLFAKSQNSAWGKSMKRARGDESDEAKFPKVTFLELFAVDVKGSRRSRVGKLPPLLRNSTSEYAYLFSVVMAGVSENEDHERLFLLPNATRRILEIFASYKAPHRTDFIQQLEVLAEESDGQPFRDVYDFCNKYSHGEGGETIDSLDGRVVHGQIKRCMQFLRAVDPEHFERMCKAAKIDPSTLD